jgi:hypothetical protein
MREAGLPHKKTAGVRRILSESPIPAGGGAGKEKRKTVQIPATSAKISTVFFRG